MSMRLLPILFLLILAGTAHAANTPVGPANSIQANGGNGQYVPWVLGGGLAITTSGGTTFLNSTSTGAAAPAGGPGAIQYNCSGIFCGYGIGSNLGVSGGDLNVIMAGTLGSIQLNGNSAFSSVGLPSNSLLGAVTSGTPIPVVLGTGLSLTTSGGITTINATGGGSTCPSTAIIEENGPCIIEENGPYIIEE